MLPLLAWRNIWRNPTRSFVVILAICLGVWAAIMLTGFVSGMMESYVKKAIETSISHAQIHHPDYIEDELPKYFIEHPLDIKNELEQNNQVKAVAIRSVVNGMISSTKGARGIKIKGIEPDQEQHVVTLDQDVKEGSFFKEDRKNQILISENMAEKLDISLRKKVVLTFQNLEGEITAGAFRVVGIFDTGNNPFDNFHVFVQRKDLNRLLNPNQNYSNPDTTINSPIDYQEIGHEIAILLKEGENVLAFQDTIGNRFDPYLMRTYYEISPDVELYESQMESISTIYLTVIMLALIFGIINTMLMAVLERIKELGMLMAIGMNKAKVFFMIFLETILLSILAAPFGMLLGYLSIQYFGSYGLNLSAFSESLQNFGMDEIIYFKVNPELYLEVPIAIMITAVLASIYPALKAIRLRPVEAIRKL